MSSADGSAAMAVCSMLATTKVAITHRVMIPAEITSRFDVNRNLPLNVFESVMSPISNIDNLSLGDPRWIWKAWRSPSAGHDRLWSSVGGSPDPSCRKRPVAVHLRGISDVVFESKGCDA